MGIPILTIFKNSINMKRLSKLMMVCIMAAVMVMSVGCDKEK